MCQNMILGSNGVDRVHSLRKILTQLRGTNFFINVPVLNEVSYAHETVSNPSKQYEMRQNMSMGSNGLDRVHSLWKILTRLRGTNFCTSSARFAPSFVRPPNGPKWTQMIRNTPKCQFRVKWVDRVCSLRKILTRLLWRELLHHFSPFCTEFCKATKWSQMHPNSTIHTKTWV